MSAAELRRDGMTPLASGPTRAYGPVRRMLQQSFETNLCDQLAAEKESIVAVSGSEDAQEGIAAFVAKRPPQFRGG
jgi:2-(1,2-epoxy-1,2-dihydrophenyl)acetyl-CoA isomerase